MAWEPFLSTGFGLRASFLPVLPSDFATDPAAVAHACRVRIRRPSISPAALTKPSRLLKPRENKCLNLSGIDGAVPGRRSVIERVFLLPV